MLLQASFRAITECTPLAHSGEGDEIKKSGLGADFFYSGGGGLATISRTQNPIIEIYLGTLQPRDFPYLPVCFIAIYKI